MQGRGSAFQRRASAKALRRLPEAGVEAGALEHEEPGEEDGRGGEGRSSRALKRVGIPSHVE